jgi:very-short-patch-repair endonuclease
MPSGFPMTNQTFIERSKQIHDSFYSYEKTNFIRSHTKIVVTCPNHGDFRTKPYNHLNGSGCMLCGREKTTKARRLNQKDFLQRIKEIHGDTYIFDNAEYVNSRTKVSLICRKHGLIKMSPRELLQGSGCRKCLNKTEGKLREILCELIPKSEIISEKIIFNLKRMDFYIPELSLYIELDGRQHFENINHWNTDYRKQLENDVNKTINILNNGCHLIRIYQPWVCKDKSNIKDMIIECLEDIVENPVQYIGPDGIYEKHENLLRTFLNE